MSRSPRGVLRRGRGGLTLAFAIALAAGVLVTIGGTLGARASEVLGPPQGDAHLYVVARAPLVEAAREGLSFHPEVTILGEHGVDEILGATAVPRGGSEALRVLEVAVPRRRHGDTAEAVATLQQIDGVVEVIVLGGAPSGPPPAVARRLAAAGAGLVALGCLLFVGGVVLSATVTVRDRADEIAVRYLLGAEPRDLWRPLGFALGGTALAGVLGALAATVLGVWFLAPDDGGLAGPGPGLGVRGLLGLAAATVAFLAGAAGSALLATRRAVGRIIGEPARLLGIALALAVAGAAPAGAAAVPSDWHLLRSVARELATCRRGLHEAEKALTTTELRALRAYARQDAVLLQLATAQREAEARLVERWRESCAALAEKRAQLRIAHRTAVAPGPPIKPRRPPVAGSVAIAFGEAGRRGTPRAFRNGVGLRTRPGEAIRATARGKVVYVGELSGLGHVIVVSHGRRTYSIYGRVAEALVMRGMEVEAGEEVARADAEGGIIYFSVRARGKPVDPVAWLRFAESAPEPVAAASGG